MLSARFMEVYEGEDITALINKKETREKEIFYMPYHHLGANMRDQKMMKESTDIWKKEMK